MSKNKLKTSNQAKKQNDNHNIANDFLSIDFSQIPSSDEFQKVKVKPQRRWFNSWMAIMIAIIGICLGVIIAYLILFV